MTIKVDVDTPAIRNLIRDTLHAYSEWLDCEGLVRETECGDDRTHDELVDDFLEIDDVD